MSLIYYPDSRPGILRRRRGRGFSYLAPDGTLIEQAGERLRIKKLGIPPAYEQVWISPHHNGHLQATGRDVKERKQYLYHADWSLARSTKKYDQLVTLGHALPRLRRWIASRLKGEVGEQETAVAAVLALIDRGSLRPGHADYAAMNGSYGATTLRKRHVAFDGGSITLDYVAKGGKKVTQTIHGGRLHKVLQQSRYLPGRSLITWLDDHEEPHSVQADHINHVLSDLCGEGFTAKTLRTWNGSHAAFLAAMEAGALTIKAMAEATSERLHNTPSIARSSYIHPKIIDLAELDEGKRREMLGKLRVEAQSDQYRHGEPEMLAFLG